MLHLFLGLIRGAWAGPVFPQGFREEEKIREQVAAWTVDETRAVPTWFPQRSPIQLGDLFDGFIRKWCDQTWNGVLKTALGWYVASNSSRAPNETRIVMALVALDLLAWVEIVETRNLHSRSDFNALSAAGRLRCLFHRLNIPLDVPEHFTEVQSLREGDARDVPGIIARLRNALVHATENSRDLINALSGVQLWEAGQLALQSIELCLLAVCGYRGRYARRAWRDWKGEDETIVPCGHKQSTTSRGAGTFSGSLEDQDVPSSLLRLTPPTSMAPQLHLLSLRRRMVAMKVDRLRPLDRGQGRGAAQPVVEGPQRAANVAAPRSARPKTMTPRSL
jgi:hypothetical protein